MSFVFIVSFGFDAWRTLREIMNLRDYEKLSVILGRARDFRDK